MVLVVLALFACLSFVRMYCCNSNYSQPNSISILFAKCKLVSEVLGISSCFFHEAPVDFVHKFFIHIRKGLLYIAVIFLNEN